MTLRGITVAAVLAVVTALAPGASAQIVLPQPTLPVEIVRVADQHGVPVPKELRLDTTFFDTLQLRADLKAATEKNLEDMGHKQDPAASAIAQEWADQAARGEVTFYGEAGKGNTYAPKGNIYRMSVESGKQRLAWLNQPVPVNPTPNAPGYGVAVSAARGEIYLVEYFR